MGTSVQMIDATYGHLAYDSEDRDKLLFDAYDAAMRDGHGRVVGTISADDATIEAPSTGKTLPDEALSSFP